MKFHSKGVFYNGKKQWASPYPTSTQEDVGLKICEHGKKQWASLHPTSTQEDVGLKICEPVLAKPRVVVTSVFPLHRVLYNALL